MAAGFGSAVRHFASLGFGFNPPPIDHGLRGFEAALFHGAQVLAYQLGAAAGRELDQSASGRPAGHS